MPDFLHRVFSSGELALHGSSHLWQLGVVWLNVVSDGLIAASYLGIVLAVAYFSLRRKDSAVALRDAIATCAATEARFRAALDGMRDAFYIFDAVKSGSEITDFRFVAVNEVGLARSRKTREQVVGRLYSELYANARSSGILQRLVQVQTTQEAYDFDYQVTEASIDANWVHIHVAPLLHGVAITSSEITERRAMRRERELHATILKNMSEGLCLLRALDGMIVFTNQKFDTMLGYEAGELTGQPVASIKEAGDDQFAQRLHLVRVQGELQFEIRNVRKDRSVIWCRATASLLHDEDHGEVVVIVIADITEHKQLEERAARRTLELRAAQEVAFVSEARLRAAADGMSEAFYIADAIRDSAGTIADFRLVDCNRAAALRFGCERDALIGSLQSVLASQGRIGELVARMTRVLETGVAHEEEYEVFDAAAASAWLQLRIVPLKNGVAVTSADISERRRIDEERSLHAAVITCISAGVLLIRASDHSVLYANPTFARMLGYEDHELEGKPVSLLRPGHIDDFAAPTSVALIQELRERGMTTYETSRARKDGALVLCRATSTTLNRPPHGEVWVTVNEDISVQRRLEEERDGFFTLSLDMLCVAGFDGYFKQLNPAWQTTLGWTLEELRAQPFLHLVHPDDVERTVAETARLSAGQISLEFENRYRHKDGHYRDLQWRAVPALRHQVIFAVARDITSLREAGQAVKVSLAEKEVLLKEIHHRVKNNLQMISSLLKLHGDQISDPRAKSAFADSQDRVRSIALLHEKLYQSKNLGSVSAADYVQDLVQTLMRTHGRVEAARVVVEAAGIHLPLDLAVPCGLILNELITNALKYAFAPYSARSPEMRIALSEDAGDLTLSVSDNGVGIAGDFDLAKSQTLGMHLVRTLARQLRAKVTMTSQAGTHWRFQFPRQPGGIS